jgi:hypothetical protein
MSEPTPVPPPAAAAPVAPVAPVTPVAPVAPAAEAAPSERCPNCSAPMQGPFCFACGQSRKGLIRHFSSILGDFADSVLQLDNRTWRTLGPLYFKPGYLSNEYFAGRRVRYVTPLRLYFFLSLIAFLVISAVTELGARIDENGNLALGPPDRTSESRDVTPAEREKALRGLDEALRFVPEAERAKVREEVERELAGESAAARESAAVDAKVADVAKDAADAQRIARAVEDAKRDDDDEPSLNFDGTPWHRTRHPLTFSWLPDTVNEALNDEIEVLIRKIRRIKDDPAPFVRQIFSTAPQSLFVILPVFALLLKFFFIFKRRLYMEHLIVALHSHSFICFSLILIVLLNKLQGWLAPDPGFAHGLFGWMIGLSCAWIPLYLLLMQKRVYRQNWIFTLFKYGLIGICYVFLLTFGMLLTMLVSLVLL